MRRIKIYNVVAGAAGSMAVFGITNQSIRDLYISGVLIVIALVLAFRQQRLH